LTDLAYPGWQATLDGDPVPTCVVDGMFRGVDVPAGRHEIVWRYRPRSFRIGMVVSLATVVLLGGIAIVRDRSARRRIRR
ncbi:MAG: YfhO family protein, partial [Planctomycetaceae bacterium]